MKFAFAGFDLLYPALETLASVSEVGEIFTCKTNNKTEFNTKVISLAKSRKIPYTDSKLTADDLRALQEDGFDALLCAGYYYRLPIAEGFPMVNIHPALLPDGRGAWPMPVTILRGMKKSGVTMHKMAASFDTGEILLQRSFELSPREDLRSFMEKTCALLPQMVRELVTNFDRLYQNAVPQGAGSYWACPTEPDWTVDETTDFAQADLILRAFYGYECVYCGHGERWELIGGRAIPGENAGQPFAVRGGYITAEQIRKLTDV